jgi:hypothetical protein
MTYKIDAKRAADGYRLEVQGLVDAAALDGIRAAIAARAGTLRVVLREGCQVEPAILLELRRLERVELIAESPFLARWLGRI